MIYLILILYVLISIITYFLYTKKIEDDLTILDRILISLFWVLYFSLILIIYIELIIIKLLKFLKNKINRNVQGILFWFIITLFFTFIISLPIMIYREYYLYKKYLKPCNLKFEYDDIIRYSITILVSLIIQILILL